MSPTFRDTLASLSGAACSDFWADGMFTVENGKTVTSSAAQTARFMWKLLARRMVSASVASNVIRNSGCGKRKDVNFCAWSGDVGSSSGHQFSSLQRGPLRRQFHELGKFGRDVAE